MKVTSKMINKQLRLKGKLIDIVSAASSEEKFINNAKRNKRVMDKLFAGKNIKGLNCSEQYI